MSITKTAENQQLNIADVIKSYTTTAKKLSKLEKQILDYCSPKIEEAKKLKDMNNLQNLLNELPDGVWKLFIYKAMEEVRNSL